MCTKEIHIRIQESLVERDVLLKLRALCQRFPGETPVILSLICDNGQIAFVKVNSEFNIAFSMDVESQINALFDEDVVLIKPLPPVNDRKKKTSWKKTLDSVF